VRERGATDIADALIPLPAGTIFAD
jgi:hypothetical protein